MSEEAKTETDAAPAVAARTPAPKPSLSREDSLGEVPAANEKDDDPQEEEYYARRHSLDEQDYCDLPPGRMHATRVPERLSGSTGSLHIPPSLSSAANKRLIEGGTTTGTSASSRSRSRSPSMKDKLTAATTTTDANSSISSLDDIVDQDILYDRAGLTELDLADSQRKLQQVREYVSLPPVSERLSEDTLEDVHAFSDVPRSSNASRCSRGNDNMSAGMLEPLNECDNEDNDDDGYDLDKITEEDHTEPETQVILTNLDNLTLGAANNTNTSGGARTRDETAGEGGGESLEEAPSARTA